MEKGQLPKKWQQSDNVANVANLAKTVQISLDMDTKLQYSIRR